MKNAAAGIFFIIALGFGGAAHGQSANSAIAAVWANDGGDKVTQDELRASNGTSVTNSLWDGSTISLFGAMNEVVNFNMILEAPDVLGGERQRHHQQFERSERLGHSLCAAFRKRFVRLDDNGDRGLLRRLPSNSGVERFWRHFGGLSGADVSQTRAMPSTGGGRLCVDGSAGGQ